MVWPQNCLLLLTMLMLPWKSDGFIPFNRLPGPWFTSPYPFYFPGQSRGYLTTYNRNYFRPVPRYVYQRPQLAWNGPRNMNYYPNAFQSNVVTSRSGFTPYPIQSRGISSNDRPLVSAPAQSFFPNNNNNNKIGFSQQKATTKLPLKAKPSVFNIKDYNQVYPASPSHAFHKARKHATIMHVISKAKPFSALFG